MSKQKQENNKTRRKKASLAVAIAPAEINQIKSKEKFETPGDGDISSLPGAQPSFDFNGARPGPYNRITGSVGVNRIQFANPTDLYSITASSKAVSKARQSNSARRTTPPARLPAIVSDPSLLDRAAGLLRKTFQRLTKQLTQRSHHERKLDLLEIQQLGEKRFLAIARVGKQKFLIGGAATSVSLLAEINSHNATVITPQHLAQERA
jgi:hypothetical protein